MIATITPIAISATLNVTARRWIWGVVVILWLIGGIRSLASDNTEGFGQGVTASLVERFGLLTIIVLGEVVVGVVNGINDAPDRDALTIGVGLAGLTIGMGIWWTYFDLLGGRVPGQRGMRLAVWLFAHLPLTMAIAASGAAIVSLVEHAHARRTPADTAWLLGISIVVVLIGIAAANLALPEDAFPPGMARQIAPVLGGAGILVLAVVAVRPAPLVLALVIDLTLMLGWLWLLVVFLARGGVPYGQVADSDAA
jgi:low temperature requirement protein LtrA